MCKEPGTARALLLQITFAHKKHPAMSAGCDESLNNDSVGDDHFSSRWGLNHINEVDLVFAKPRR